MEDEKNRSLVCEAKVANDAEVCSNARPAATWMEMSGDKKKVIFA